MNSPQSKRCKLALIIPTLDQGGAEKQLVLLAEHLERSRFDVVVITVTRSGHYLGRLQQAGIPVIEINKRSKFDPLAIHRLTKCLKSIQPDIVHTWIFAANAYGRYAAIKAKVPVIIGGERCVDPWKRGWQLLIDKYLAKRSKAIVCNSSGIRDFYSTKGLHADQFQIIHNGIEPRAASSIDRVEALKRLSLPSDAKIIASVGRLWHQKGYKDLVWAASMLNMVHKNYHFVIFGDGPQRDILEQHRNDIGAVHTVHFAGHRNDISELMPHFDLFWNGSLYEGQSNSILEAMQAGVPVVASDISGNRDLVQHEQTGMLYPVVAVDQLNRHSTRFIEDAALSERVTSAAKQRIATEFSVERMVQAHESLYLRLLNQSTHEAT
jgi:glycosyltransferase involved in cell wall biosynthesis